MRTSEKLDQIATALLKFQQMIEPPVKNRTANTGKYDYDYADLCALFAHCKSAMVSCGLVFTSVGLTSRLLHVSGQWIEGDFQAPDGLMPQQMGSAMTYGRRYNFQGLLGINAEEDDDGAAATRPTQQQAVKPAAPKMQLRKLPPHESKIHPPAEQDGDRVPAEVTDGQAQTAEVAEVMEVCTLKALTKEKSDRKGNQHRGLLLSFPDGSEEWWNCYHKPSMDAASKLKDKQVRARLEDKGGFKVCHEVTEVTA